MPFEDASFDFVVASELVEHLSDTQRTQGLQEIARTLNLDGYFLGTVPWNEDLQANMVVCPHCGELFHRWGHQRSFTCESLRAVLEPCFRDIKVRRTAFVSFRGRSLLGKLSATARLLLARWGQPIAIPSIIWQARKKLI